jgi:hypothetical protein
LTPGAFKLEEGFVDHQLNLLVATPRAIPQPKTESQVHRPVSISMRNPLHKNPARGGEAIQLFTNPAQIVGSKLAELAMDMHGI